MKKTLKDVFRAQEKLQNREFISKMSWIEQVRLMTLATQIELGEALQTLSWKPWRDTPHDLFEFRKELIDVLHFYIALCLLAGFSDEDLIESYFDKNAINKERMKK